MGDKDFKLQAVVTKFPRWGLGIMSSCTSSYDLQGGTAIRGGQRFTSFYCTSFKTNICVDTEGAL